MKARYFFVGLYFLIGFNVMRVSAQEFRKTFHRNLESKGVNTVGIFNVNGNVKVEGYHGNNIVLTYEKIIRGNTKDDVSRGLNEVNLITEDSEGNVLIYLSAPFIHTRNEGNRIHYNINEDNLGYRYTFDITIRVPRNMPVNASTINGHEVEVDGIYAPMEINNVNGSVKMSGISGKTTARTVNGNIIADYDRSPDTGSLYKTINGKIDLTFPKNFSGDFRYHIMNGHFYTNFDEVSSIPTKADVVKRATGNGIRYKIEKDASIRIGKGGAEYTTSVLNGNIFVKHQ